MSFGKQLVSSSKVLTVSNYMNMIVSLIISIIIARVLDPKIFGIIAAASLIINFLTIIGSAGLGTAMVQLGDSMSNAKRFAVLMLAIASAIVFGVIFYFSTGIWEMLFDFEGLSTYLELLIVGFFCSILIGPLQGYFYGKKKFFFVGINSIVATISSGIIGVLLAYNGYEEYALIWKIILYQLFLLIPMLIGYIKGLGISTDFNLGTEFWSYVKHSYYTQIISFSSRNLDNVLVGRFLGAYSLALYDVSYRIMRQPVSSLGKVLTPIIQPLFKGLNLTESFNHYNRIARFMAQIGFFVSLICVILGGDLIEFLYGDKWVEAGVIFQILSTTILFHLLLSGVGGVMLASGNQKYLSRSVTYSTVTTLVLIFFGVLSNDLILFSYFYTLSIVINFFQSFYLLYVKVYRFEMMDLFKKSNLGLLLIAYFLYYFLFFILRERGLLHNGVHYFYFLVGLALFFYITNKMGFIKEVKYFFKLLRR